MVSSGRDSSIRPGRLLAVPDAKESKHHLEALVIFN
jgi:hypothetical protein